MSILGYCLYLRVLDLHLTHLTVPARALLTGSSLDLLYDMTRALGALNRAYEGTTLSRVKATLALAYKVLCQKEMLLPSDFAPPIVLK